MLFSTLIAQLAMTWAAVSPSINWQKSYSSAVFASAEQKKPLVVFLGHGQNGVERLVVNGIGEQENRSLSNLYVTFYVDVDSEAGKALAKSFDLSQGIVISDRNGELQALRHEGTITQVELKNYLVKYSEPGLVVDKTKDVRNNLPFVEHVSSPSPATTVVQASPSVIVSSPAQTITSVESGTVIPIVTQSYPRVITNYVPYTSGST
jgi:hypothetical protein